MLQFYFTVWDVKVSNMVLLFLVKRVLCDMRETTSPLLGHVIPSPFCYLISKYRSILILLMTYK